MHVMSLKWTFNVVESSKSSLLSLEIFNFSNRSQFIELKVSAKAGHSGLNEECLTSLPGCGRVQFIFGIATR